MIALSCIKLKIVITINRQTAIADAYPRFKLVKASCIIRYANKDVESPGPPDVIAYTKSKLVNRHIVKKIERLSIVFIIFGSVIEKKARTGPAPSIFAAS